MSAITERLRLAKEKEEQRVFVCTVVRATGTAEYKVPRRMQPGVHKQNQAF